MNPSSANPRALALQTLLGVAGGQYGNLAVDAVLRRHELSEPDRHLFTALVYGVLERQVTLDYLLSRLSDRPPESLDATVLTALRLGLYQLIYMDRIPDHAAVGETVALVPRRVSGYVNAVLRAYLRMEDSLPTDNDGQRPPRENRLISPAAWTARFPDLAADETGVTALSVAFGMPAAMCHRFIDAMGTERAASVLRAMGDKPPIALRVNPLHTTRDALRTSLSENGFPTKDGWYAPHALRLSEGAVTELPGFAEGDFFVQDEASQLCVAALDARPGHTVIDTCACPGSKSFGLALDMQDTGVLYAFDLHKSKLSLIDAGATRLGLHIIRTAERDARNPDSALLGKADRVLCDVPCSGLGVMAKKPEIRHKNMTASERLPAIQAAILEASAHYLKVGGELVYSTCTVLPEENERIVGAFLASHPAFEPVDFAFPARADGADSPTADCPDDIRSRDGRVTLLPDANRTDGFFIAKLRRTR